MECGDFPNTVLASDSEITFSSKEVYNGWYLGSDGYFYEKLVENGCDEDKELTYSDGSVVNLKTDNKERYFKVEPIVWRVLTEDYNSTGTKLLFAENILTASAKALIANTTVDNGGESTTDTGNNFSAADGTYGDGSEE